VVDLGPGPGGCEASLARLRRGPAKVGVVVVYDRLSSGEVSTLLRSGVERFVPYTHGLAALRTILLGYHRHARAASPADLTDREQEVVELISAGHTVDRIAELLGVQASAVVNAKRRIYQKLSVVSQTQAVARAVALGLVAGSVIQAQDGDSGHRPELPELTPRECDVLRSIADGHTVRQSARALGIATKTVENTQARLFRKLGVRNRNGALTAAHAIGLLELVSSKTP
jgi:DNA-binding CsgD family transcriptional regulator